jgi:sigma-E factor negative regulatory protein RseC
MNGFDSVSIIDHEAIVQGKGNDSITVKFISVSACNGCHAESSCVLSGSEEKVIEIPGKYDLGPGDQVIVTMKQSSGYEAVLLAYFMPFILVTALLVLLISMGITELVSGLISISSLVPYYALLFLFRKRISRRFNFTLKV